MKKDRELLELAAKAAGIFLTPETLKATFPKWEWNDTDEPVHLKEGGMLGTVVVYSYSGELSGTTRKEWHPLTDDGDALRLASTLEMMIDFMDCRVCAGHAHPEVVIDFDDGDHKRAIVRAAAAIGEVL